VFVVAMQPYKRRALPEIPDGWHAQKRCKSNLIATPRDLLSAINQFLVAMKKRQ
jgi:hypothetical protein